ncbi:MAG: energy transducer TonB [bacterium]|nr:energy transducer TonB [bacterium]
MNTVNRNRPPQAISRRIPHRYPKGTPGSFTLSVIIHSALLLLLGIGSVTQVEKQYELTEISYLEERYGKEVAEKVTLAPEKVAEVVEKRKPPKREGSLFAEAKPKPVAERQPLVEATMTPSVPLPKPKARPKPKAFQAPKLKSRTRTTKAPLTPQIAGAPSKLAAAVGNSPNEPGRVSSESVNLNGKALVGRKARGDKPVFEVTKSESGGSSLAGGGLTLSVPTGGVADGHPELKGGVLPEGKSAYKGKLPTGSLTGGKSSRGDVTNLAGMGTPTPAHPSDGPAMTAPVAEPTAGTGLVSRGGSDSFSQGSLLKPKSAEHKPADILAKIKQPVAEGKTQAPAEPVKVDSDKDVTMTLSGPILGRDIIKSSSPIYPAIAKTKGWQGTVSIYFTVRPDGTIKKAVVERASVYQVLDEATRKCIQEWKFSPLAESAEQWGVLTINFKLN